MGAERRRRSSSISLLSPLSHDLVRPQSTRGTSTDNKNSCCRSLEIFTEKHQELWPHVSSEVDLTIFTRINPHHQYIRHIDHSRPSCNNELTIAEQHLDDACQHLDFTSRWRQKGELHSGYKTARRKTNQAFLRPYLTYFLVFIFKFLIVHQPDIVHCERLFRLNHHQQSAAYPLPINYQIPQQTNTAPVLKSINSMQEFIAQQGGIIKDKNILLTKQSNPIVIKKDIIIKRDAKLTIESGSELLFDKKKGIIVYGILEILGTSNDKVKLNLLKSQQSATINFRSQSNNQQQPQRPQQQQVRFVDGDLPSEGRVQIKLNGKWYSLCTNSKNLTAADIKVLCRQVGYQEGAWYKWFPRRNETTFQVMTKSFHCSGDETTVTQCRRWNRIRSGGGVCDNHSDIGVRCSKKIVFQQDDLGNTRSVPIYDYWRGIEFVNSETQQEYVLDGQMKQRVSRSRLNHLTISEAGLDDVGNATAAIRVYGQPPKLNDIEIRNSVYGIMIEEVNDVVTMNNIRLTNNIGYPLFVNTSWGKVSLDHMHVESNGGDGIRIVRHEKTLIGSHDFCKFANLGTSQSYPVILSHEQQFLTTGNDCCQEFISHNQLTVHFPVLRSTPNNLLPESDNNRRISVPPGVELGKDANLVIYDDYRDEFPFKLQIQNGTRAQSIVSKSGRLKICYEPASYRTVLFTVEIVADVDDDDDVVLIGNHDERGTGIARDVEISNSYIRRNEGRGIWVDNQRSGIRIINTTVIQHNYLSGVHVENGTGEVIIQASQISNNTGHGLYINLAGGYYHIDNSSITGNTLSGIAIEYDKRSELVPFNHTMHIGYSLIAHNGENGLFIGNVCRSDAYWNISMNSFIKNGEDAIIFESCHPTQDNVLRFNNLTSRLNTSDQDSSLRNVYQELFITHNVFLENFRRAIKLAPVFFLKSFIRHNLFKDHPLAVLYINNRAFEDQLDNSTAAAPVNIRVASNRFYTNRGRYVANIGLQEDSPKQSLMFTKNYLEDNVITEPYTDLRPRSRVSAVVVVSSGNTKVVRNRFINPRSNYEMGTHLEAHSKIINATANFWGHGLDASSIYRRIFDRKNRYNLAQVEFLQYLLSPEDLEYITDLSFDRERDKITTFKNGTRLGGEIKGFEELPPDTYVVHDDIFIRPGSHLILKPGTVIKFHDGVGLMVQGRLDALGQPNSQIQFTSIWPSSRMPQKAAITTTTTVAPFANPWVSHQPDGSSGDEYSVPVNGSSSSSSSSSPSRRRFTRQLNVPSSSVNNVRLSHTTMGRLEVQIDGFWGPVCDYNFDINDAAVVCQQLGMILNKEDWMLERFQYAANDQQQLSMMTADALMTNLRCDPALDTDVTACKAEISSRGDFDGICNSEVGIRCFPPSWSGIRLGMGAEISTLENVVIQRAGMFDYATYALRPALQIDFFRHWLSSLVIKSNSDSGLGIMFNDVIGRHFNELSIVDSKFINNERHGIETRSRGLTIKGCTMSSNRQNGLDYNPSMSNGELEDLLSWLKTARNSDNVVHITFPLRSSNNHFSVPSSEESYRFFVLPANPPANLKESFTIGTDPGHMLSVHLISPINHDSTEVLNMSLGLNLESPIWDLRVNTTSFPMISPGYKFHFNYTSGSRPLGNIVLYIRSRYNNRDLKVLTKFIPPHLVMAKFDQTATNINAKLINALVISNCTLIKNGIGLKFRHADYAYGPSSVYNRRYSNETTNITNNIFDSNYFSSIFVASDEQDIHFSNTGLEIPTSEIRYNVFGNKIRRNKDGIRQFSRDIRYSHNVFHWTINSTTFEQNRGGGINIVLPYYWKYDLNMSHTVELANNSFLKNTNFELGIDGHYVMLNVTNNMFRENRCRNRLIGFSGMEKQLAFRHNVIENNICNRIVDFNIHSHADKMGSVPTIFEFNALRHNMRLLSNSSYAHLTSNFRYPKLLPRLHPLATDYALALRGVQALNITRNIFLNPELRFELVVAIIMDPDERTVNAIENYWGSVIPSEIGQRIFDFDDWNSYALAELSPFLIRDSLFAASMVAEARDVHHTMSTQSLGGRLMKSIVLPYRKEPYIIESDFTIMPNVKLTIDRGVTLDFMPNVGILVLGELIAAGSRDKPIQMRPLLAGSDVVPLRQYLFPTKTRPNITQVGLSDPLSYEHNYAFKHYQYSYSIDMGSVRLCKNEICNDGSHIYENNVEDPVLRQEVLDSTDTDWKMDGFLEIYNMTTLQWTPVCDPLFTEFTAKTVCRQLGYTHLSLFKRGRRYTIEQEQVPSVKNWAQSVQCEGDESNLSSCPLAATGFMNHSTACHRESNQFVYVYCRDFPDHTTTGLNRNRAASNEHLHHWGGIRFSCPNKASMDSLASVPYQFHNTSNHIGPRANGQSRSMLQYVSIDRAGLLHRKKAPAIQVLQCNVHLEYVAVTNSAHHGIEMITSNANQNFHQLRIKNNLGIGVNYLSLTGSSSATRLVPYLPLKHLDLSSDIFGLVDICGANKEIRIDERILLFYRYSSRPVDCVKIIKSKLGIKHLGIRMLQFDLFNSTALTSRPDHVRIYDGNVFDPDSRLLVELGVEERHRVDRPELKFYQSSDSSMTVRVHASGAGPYQGFIAEVVTTPISYNIQRDLYNNVTFSDISNNKLGALMVSSAGESTPNLMIRNNRFESNCLHLFGNFTSCLVSVNMELQNCQKLKLTNNLIKANIGGLMIKSYSRSAISALDASIENNVFEANQNTYTLALLGPKTDPYQRVNVVDNFFTRNLARYLPNIVLSNIVANFSDNIVSGNIGKHQIEVVGFDKLPLSYQNFYNNWIYNNTATFERDQSTISSNSAGQQFSMNYFVNPDNHFEISTKNWSRYDVRPLHVPRDDEMIHLASGDGSTKDVMRKTADLIPLNIIDAKRLDLYHATIDAKHNWWGFNSTHAIQGRIRDRMQHEKLIKVDFAPFLESNRTILSGICSGGWQRVNGACLVYIGTRMTYQEARDFCDRERAAIPLLRGDHIEITEFIESQDPQYDARIDRIWVRSFDVSRDACPALNAYRTRNYECQDKYAFVCEKDPQVVVSFMFWYRERAGLLVLFLAFVTIILTCCCSVCWLYKSRQRHKEKILRKNSLYASMRSNRAGPYASNNSLSELFLHRQLYNTDKQPSIVYSSSSTTLSSIAQQGSDDLNNLVRLDPGANSRSSKRYNKQPTNNSKSRGHHQEQSLMQTRHQTPANKLAPRHGQQQQQQTRPNELYQQQQVAYNPDYVGQERPYPMERQHSRDKLDYMMTTATAPVPVPSNREQHPRMFAVGSAAGSKTPSTTGSFTNDQVLSDNPMPLETFNYQHNNLHRSATSFGNGQSELPRREMNETASRALMSSTPNDEYHQFEPLPPPPLAATTIIKPPPPLSFNKYSDIRFNENGNATNGGNNDEYTFRQNAANNGGVSGLSGDDVRLVHDMAGPEVDSSSQPTYYNNQIESFEESTNSYLETYNVYNDTYRNELQPINNGDQVSLVLTEQSSITDLITTTRTIEKQMNLISMHPEGGVYSNIRPSGYGVGGIRSDSGLSDDLVVGADNRPRFHTSHSSGSLINNSNHNGPRGAGGGAGSGHISSTFHSKAASDAGSLKSNRSNMMETSFDFDGQTLPMGSSYQFDGSQRLSPVSSSFAPTDSKQGSRVYLETTFE